MAEQGKDDWALCVGIGEYVEESGLDQLPGALNDAKRFFDWVADASGGNVPQNQRRLILSPKPQNQDEPEPIADDIETFLTKLVKKAKQNNAAGKEFYVGRRLYLYFSGHGVSLGEKKNTVLLTSEAAPPEECWHFASPLWAEWFGIAHVFDQIFLVMDCCRSPVHNIMPHEPPFRRRVAGTSARFFHAYAVADGTSAREIEIDGKAAGVFTSKLIELLEDQTQRPLSASDLKGLLYQELIGHDEPVIKIPDSPREDFVLLDAPLPRLVNEAVRAALDRVATASLTIHPQDKLARLRVWNTDGELLAERDGSARLSDLPQGTYKIQASIGKSYFTQEIELSGDRELVMEQVPLDTPMPLPESTMWSDESRASLETLDREVSVMVIHKGLAEPPRGVFGDDRIEGESQPVHDWTASAFNTETSRFILEMLVSDRWLALSIPVVPGYRTEVYAAGFDAIPPDVSIRLVSASEGVGAPLETDRVRESLRLIYMHDGLRDRCSESAVPQGDPVAVLLALASDIVNGFVDQVAAILGEDDADVQCWRAQDTIHLPPLLMHSWLTAGSRGVAVEPDSLADRLVGREVALGPWLVWDTNPKRAKQWLRDVASRSWPGWNSEPDCELAAQNLDEVAKEMGIPADAVYRAIYKSPPIDRLVKHHKIAFVGASNDQLAAALTIAFVTRKHEPWEHLDLYFLNDELLKNMVSAGRSGAPLRRARDRTQKELARIFPLIAKKWRIFCYDGFFIQEQWHFASLWDWTEPGGFVHVSPYNPGEDVRYTLKVEEEWPIGQSQPSEKYAEAVCAYEQFAPTATTLIDSG